MPAARPTRAALYARVSTQDQNTDSQLDALRGYAQARGLELAGEYVDHGVSGAKARRPALDRMLQDARRRRLDVVVAVKLDRLARRVRHLTELAGELEALGVDLVVLDQSIETSTPAGRFLFNTLAAVAELERDLIRERVRAGMAAAKRRGRRFGPSRLVSEEDAARVALLREQGHSLRAIARRLGVSHATVQREVARLGVRRAA